MIWVFVITLLIAVVTLVISTVYAIMAASKVTKVATYGSDGDLKKAHGKLTFISILGSIGIFAIVVILGLGIYLSFSESDSAKQVQVTYTVHKSKVPIVLGIVLGIVCIGLVFMAIFTGIAASEINGSNSTGTRGAYNDAIISTVLSSSTVVVIVLSIVLYYVLHHRRENDKAEETSNKEHKGKEERNTEITQNEWYKKLPPKEQQRILNMYEKYKTENLARQS